MNKNLKWNINEINTGRKMDELGYDISVNTTEVTFLYLFFHSLPLCSYSSLFFSIYIEPDKGWGDGGRIYRLRKWNSKVNGKEGDHSSTSTGTSWGSIEDWDATDLAEGTLQPWLGFSNLRTLSICPLFLLFSFYSKKQIDITHRK